MDTNYSDRVMAFDMLFTTNHIQILKILLPVLDRGVQKQLAVYIKLLELQYTLNFFQENPYAQAIIPEPTAEGENDDAIDLCREILPFCSPNEKEKVQNLINMCQNFQNMQEMMQIMEMIKDISGDDLSETAFGTPMPSGPEGMDIAKTMELLQNMLSQ